MRVTWDAEEDRLYTSGISQGVLYPEDSPGVAWNGLISVTESASQSGEPKYFDGIRYHDRALQEAFYGTISAYTYPDEFESCIGISGILTGQSHSPFGFSYRTSNAIHIVYNASVSSSGIDYMTVSEVPVPVVFEWDFTTVPESIPGGRPSSHLAVMMDDANPSAVSDLEALIYGDDENGPSLPLPEVITDIFESYALLRITDNGDGTWTATGPDTAIMIAGTEFSVNWPSAIFTSATTFQISSL